MTQVESWGLVFEAVEVQMSTFITASVVALCGLEDRQEEMQRTVN